ncbi:MAG: rod shape-determining protein RodA [Chloroflexi bacterium]|nr:rod shape-determining protein RodA [Chloroflexota bacterium]
MTTYLQTHRPQIWRNFDITLLALVAILTIGGIAMIRSATFESPQLANLPFVQIRWAVIGLVVIFVITAIDYRYWKAFAHPLYVFDIAWLALVFILGAVAFGATRWVDFFGLFFIQPSEMAKIGTILWTAEYFSRNREHIKELKWVFASGIYSGIPAALVIAQPDLSTAIIIIIIWGAMIFAAGLEWKHIALFAGVGLVTLPFIFLVMPDYQRARILQFINPESDRGAQYNIQQALISIGSGGFFGQGYNHASQVNLRFLKVRHTDFIFSALSSEFGFIGSMLVIILLALVIIRILRIAQSTPDPFGALICYGTAAMLFYQSFFNIGMNMNVLPVTGLPLPFVSYGGSALLTFLFSIGLVESVALRSQEQSSSYQ